jgi:protease-4
LGILFSIDSGNIAVIKIYGVISSSDSSSLLGEATVKADNVINNLKLALANPLIEGVLLDINSPGGSAVPSALIMDAVLNFSKPLVAYIRDAGASGAYLIASAADRIVAHNYSLIGSIGAAISPYIEYSGLMERYNVTYVNLSYPEHKDMGSPYREMSDLEYNWSISKLEAIYESFLATVAINRNMTIDEMRVFANGSFYLGSEGLEYGLIDKVGSFDDALDLLVEIAGIKYPELITFEDKTSYLDLLGSLDLINSPVKMMENVIIRT